jgi:hypothetical protein
MSRDALRKSHTLGKLSAPSEISPPKVSAPLSRHMSQMNYNFEAPTVENVRRFESLVEAENAVEEEEEEAFCNLVNFILEGDRFAARLLPLSCDTMFAKLSDGLIYARLINIVKPGCIEERRLNTNRQMTIFQRNENIQIVLTAAREMGCVVIGIGVKDIGERRYKP